LYYGVAILPQPQIIEPLLSIQTCLLELPKHHHEEVDGIDVRRFTLYVYIIQYNFPSVNTFPEKNIKTFLIIRPGGVGTPQ